MKNLINYSKFALFLSLAVVLTNCGSDDPDPINPLQVASELFSGKTGVLSAAHTQSGGTVIDFAVDAFSVTLTANADFTGGTYTSNSTTDDQKIIWPTSGSWTFVGTTGTEIMRDGLVPITIAASGTAITTSFTTTDENSPSRTKEIDGVNWSFTFAY